MSKTHQRFLVTKRGTSVLRYQQLLYITKILLNQRAVAISHYNYYSLEILYKTPSAPEVTYL